MTSDCSMKNIKEFKKHINKYLLSKGVKDFTKYEIGIANDELRFIKWDYNIPKPDDVKPEPEIHNYEDLFSRNIIIDLELLDMHKHRYFNVDGVEVGDSNENDGRYIYHIIKTTPGSIYVYILNGNIKVNKAAKGEKRFDVIVLYAHKERTVAPTSFFSLNNVKI